MSRCRQETELDASAFGSDAFFLQQKTKICAVGLPLSLLQAVGSAPLCPGDHLALGMENWRISLVSVCSESSRKSKGVALGWDVIELMWDGDGSECQGWRMQ